MREEEFRLEDVIGRLVALTFAAWWKRFGQNLASSGIDFSTDQVIILANVWHREGVSQQWFVELGRDKTQVTRLIDTLEERKLARRIPDQKDRRKKLIYLTKEGRKLVKPLIKVAIKTITEAEEGIDTERLKICKEVLREVRENLIGKITIDPKQKF